jgi:hypothetical protein
MQRYSMTAELSGGYSADHKVCIDRLHQLGANEQLRVLIRRLQKLAVRANPGDDDKGT